MPLLDPTEEQALKQLIRSIPDFPKPGILFYDITTLLKNAQGLRTVIDRLTDDYRGQQIDAVLGIEARGFIFAPALAYHLGTGFVPVPALDRLGLLLMILSLGLVGAAMSRRR